ncbi:MAG TPA: hypothetical protein VHY91_06625 [Pirellulales bacterium]|jgi:hypothetical protein|nr:hypothetical protein [Pirellulales bacterium]
MDGAEISATDTGDDSFLNNPASDAAKAIAAYRDTDGAKLGKLFSVTLPGREKPAPKYPIHQSVVHNGMQYGLVSDYEQTIAVEYEVVERLEYEGEILFRAAATGKRRASTLVHGRSWFKRQ